jgi:hypothetical protein
VNDTIDTEVARYATAVRAAFADLPGPERELLLEDLEDHLLMVAELGSREAWGDLYHPDTFTTYAEPVSGLRADGQEISNIFAFDADGRPLRDVYTVDQDGDPLVASHLDTQSWMPGCPATATATRSSTATPGAVLGRRRRQPPTRPDPAVPAAPDRSAGSEPGGSEPGGP